ncbi:unnamed protein product [Brassica rapa subsp. narinosa]
MPKYYVENENQIHAPLKYKIRCYYDLQVGSRDTPSSGYLVVLDMKGLVHGTEQVFLDTFGSRKSLAMVMD